MLCFHRVAQTIAIEAKPFPFHRWLFPCRQWPIEVVAVLNNLSVTSVNNANAAIDTINNAIEAVSTQRSELGALQNRLEHTINNLGVMEENIQDAESNIRDTDIADEMMAYTKNNILIQSAQAMLAQANQVPQGVLQLMQ